MNMDYVKLPQQDIVGSMEKNMYKKLQYIPSKISTMNVYKVDQTLVVDSGLSSDTFNVAYGGSINQELANKIMTSFLNTKTPVAWWTGPSSGDVQKIKLDMQAAGFIHDEVDVGMYCDVQRLCTNQYQLPKELTIKQCKDPKDFADFGDVLASIFNPIDEYVKIFYRQIQNIPKNDLDSLKLLVGYVNNKPVSTAGLFLTDVAGIYDVSTHPSMRNKGYGSAMFCTALKLAKDMGVRYSMLQASPDGLNIYKRFGYKPICEFNVWSNKGRL